MIAAHPTLGRCRTGSRQQGGTPLAPRQIVLRYSLRSTSSQLDGMDLTDRPLDLRRAEIECRLWRDEPCVQLVLQTADAQVAREWLTLLATLEGVVAKRGDGRYALGRRAEWVKVKRYRTIECAVIAVAGDDQAVKLVLGLRHSDNRLRTLRRFRGVMCHLERRGLCRFGRASACSAMRPAQRDLGYPGHGNDITVGPNAQSRQSGGAGLVAARACPTRLPAGRSG